MANSLGTNPIYIDTNVAAIDIGDTLFGNSNTIFFIENIEWQNPANADTVEVTDAAGVPIFSQTSTGDGFSKDFNGRGVKGIKLGAGKLAGGELCITLT